MANPLGLNTDFIDNPEDLLRDISLNQGLKPQASTLIPNSSEALRPQEISEGLVHAEQFSTSLKTAIPQAKNLTQQVQKSKEEDTLRSLRASYRTAQYSFELNLLAADLLNNRGNPKAITAQIRRLENKILKEQPYIQKDSWWKSAVNNAAGILPPVLKLSVEGAKVGGYAALGAGATAAVLSSGPQATASPITIPTAMTIAFGAGSQAQATRLMARAEAGAAYWELINMKDAQGRSLNPTVVAYISQSVGAVNGLAELFGIKILTRFLPGSRRLIGSYISDASKKVMSSGLIKNLVKQYLVKYPKFVGQETGIELGQAIVTTAGEEMAKIISNKLDGTNMPAKTKEEIMKSLKDEVVTAASGIATLGVPFPMVDAIVDSKSQVQKTNPLLAEVLPKDKVLDPGQELLNAFENLKDKFLGELDVQSFKNRVHNKKLFSQLQAIVGEPEKIFPDKVTSPQIAEQLGVDFSTSELNAIMSQAGIESAKLKEEAFATKEPDMEKLNQAMQVAMKHQGAREALESQFKKETKETNIKKDKFNLWLKDKIGKEKKRKPKKAKQSKVQFVNDAMQLHIDMKRDPKKVKELYEKSKKFYEDEESIKEPKELLTKEQLALIDRANNLTPRELEFIKQMTDVYEQIGDLGLEEGVLRNLEDNFAARLWNLTFPDAQKVYSTFFKSTKHANERVINTIVEGWAKGMTLRVSGATQNLALYRDTLIKTLIQRKFFNALKEAIVEVPSDKRPGATRRQKLLLPYQAKGYKKVDLSNFKIYSPIPVGEPGGRILTTEDGSVLKETAVYAPKKVATDLENIFGISSLKKLKAVETISKYNALIKVINLAMSGFHALAYTASYYLGAPISWKDANIYKAYKSGNMMSENLDPLVLLGIKSGLTVDLQQDWQREYFRENNVLSQLMSKQKVPNWIKEQLVSLNDRWLGWVFSSLGSGLKVKTFIAEYQKQLLKFPDIAPEVLAKNVAELVNEDFGGLHLKRLGRNPTIQHIAQLSFLAPDWTESNLRTVTGLFRRTGQNPKHIRQLHRHFWARIVLRGVAATFFTNLALALSTGTANDRWESIEDFFADTMESFSFMLTELGQGNIRQGYKDFTEGATSASKILREVTSVNITPIYSYFGGNPDEQKYFSIFRHFMDPVKFLLHPARVLRHKLSIVGHMTLDFIKEEDWKGRRYTTLAELLSGEGLVTYKSEFIDGAPLMDSWYLSYAISQVIGHTPIGMSNLIASISGEMDYTDSLIRTLGIQVSTRKD